MGQDKVRMTHRVYQGACQWDCAVGGGKLYVTNFCRNGVLEEDRVWRTVKNSVEEVYEGYYGYVVKKINSFKGNV